MEKVVLFLTVVVGAFAIWPQPKNLPRAIVNLDLAPEVRYTDLINNIINTHGWDYSYAAVEGYWNTLPKDVQLFMDQVSLDMDRYFPSEYARELTGIEKVVSDLGHSADFPLKEIVALNLLYEWTTACTSIVVEDSKGQMWHARNMDWNFDGFSLFNLSSIVDFQSKGKTVYSGVQWVGYVGILSGTNPGFTCTVDQREDYTQPDRIHGNMEAIQNGAQTVGFVLREALAQVTTFSSALSKLSGSYVAAPVYYNLGGSNKGEGSIISRDRFANTSDIWKWASGPQPCCKDIEDWYLVETNYDHWTTQGDSRQEDAIHALNALTQPNVNAANLFSVLQTPNVLNSNTQYSMVVQNGGSYFTVVGWQ